MCLGLRRTIHDMYISSTLSGLMDRYLLLRASLGIMLITPF